MALSDIISAISLAVSLIVAYKSSLSRFSGKVWAATRFVLAHFDTIPCIGLACFFENVGARPGNLDDLRLIVTHEKTQTTCKFYPQLLRNDYSLYASYKDSDWFPFAGMPLTPNKRIERYIIFKPLDDAFTAKPGLYKVTLQHRWYGSKKWLNNTPTMRFELSEQIARQWNNPEEPAVQVLTKHTLEHRDEAGI